jgi:hypothetical protein
MSSYIYFAMRRCSCLLLIPVVLALRQAPESRWITWTRMYHLTEDPHELTNPYDDPKYASARADMQGILADWLATTTDPKLAPERSPEDPPK